MITALYSSSTPREIPSYSDVPIGIAKVEKVASIFFGGICLVVANSLLSCGGIIAFLSLPCYLLLLTFAIRFFAFKDYANKTKLQAFREEAKEQPLGQVIQAHGLLNILQYEILQLATFKTKLRSYLDTISPTDLAKLYLQLVDASEKVKKLNFWTLRNLSIGNFRPLFVASLNNPSRDKPSEMFEKEDMPLLLRTGLLGETFAASYQEYRQVKEARRQADEVSGQTFTEGTLAALQDLNTAITKISSESTPTTEWISTLRRDITYLRAHPYPSSAINHLPIWKDPDEQISDASELVRAHAVFKEQFKRLKSMLEKELSEHRVQFESHVGIINLRFVS